MHIKYYVTKEPINDVGYTWNKSLYKIDTQKRVEVIRFYSDDAITKEIIRAINPFFIARYCKEISQEEYEQMLKI